MNKEKLMKFLDNGKSLVISTLAITCVTTPILQIFGLLKPLPESTELFILQIWFLMIFGSFIFYTWMIKICVDINKSAPNSKHARMIEVAQSQKNHFIRSVFLLLLTFTFTKGMVILLGEHALKGLYIGVLDYQVHLVTPISMFHVILALLWIFWVINFQGLVKNFKYAKLTSKSI